MRLTDLSEIVTRVPVLSHDPNEFSSDLQRRDISVNGWSERSDFSQIKKSFTAYSTEYCTGAHYEC